MPYEQHRYLVMVDPTQNNNKFYRMIRIPQQNMWRAEYGRVGSTPMKKVYPLSVWNKKYDEKISKGYVDQSDMINVSIQSESKYREIENPKIRDFINKLLDFAKEKIHCSYSVSVESVTESMLKEAQYLINNLYNAGDVQEFNSILVNLYTVLPRKIKDVKQELIKTMEDAAESISKEQDLLEVMKGQVKISCISANELSKDKRTILEKLGLTVSEPTEKEMKEILDHLGEDKGRLKFASLAHKSIKYTSVRGSFYAHGSSDTGLLAVYKVATGTPWDIYQWDSSMTRLRETDILKKGCDSVYAHKGINLVNDEFIVYNEAAATLRYLIELQ